MLERTYLVIQQAFTANRMTMEDVVSGLEFQIKYLLGSSSKCAYIGYDFLFFTRYAESKAAVPTSEMAEIPSVTS